MDIQSIAKRAKQASSQISFASTGKKNSVLKKMAQLLQKNKDAIIDANQKDITLAKEKGFPDNIINRLIFNKYKLESRVISLNKIIALPDPVGQIRKMEKRPNGLLVGRTRVPLGVILMIYEARPHVTINAGAFALKSGNAIILKGGSEARSCNDLLGKLWETALKSEGLPGDAIQCISATHEEISGFLDLTNYIDLVIPRGGKRLIKSVTESSKIPVIKHFEGICHVFVDRDADIRKAKRIVLDSKLLMPEVCNALETLLISEDKAKDVPDLIKILKQEGIEVRGCRKTQALVHDIRSATGKDWKTEYLDKIISVKIVKDLEDAISHINRYGSGHTDSIVTENYTHASRFLREVDSSVVLVNASTMFNDGEELGMGAEIGISTDRLHARGPMGLEELTTYKFIIQGEDHIKGK